MPVFLRLLPTLTDAKLVAAIAGHLRRPWARPVAFEPLHHAFRVWALRDGRTGWALGDAMASAARAEHLPVLLDVVGNARYGSSRQMVVHALSRFKKSPDVEPALIALLTDADVALHAMGALRRSIGPVAAMPYLREVQATYEGQPLGQTALREMRKAEKAIREKHANS